jgi:hypothetical protein
MDKFIKFTAFMIWGEINDMFYFSTYVMCLILAYFLFNYEFSLI